jgi:hypothetical protein
MKQTVVTPTVHFLTECKVHILNGICTMSCCTFNSTQVSCWQRKVYRTHCTPLITLWEALQQNNEEMCLASDTGKFSVIYSLFDQSAHEIKSLILTKNMSHWKLTSMEKNRKLVLWLIAYLIISSFLWVNITTACPLPGILNAILC